MKKPFHLMFVLGVVFAFIYAHLLSIYFNTNHILDYLTIYDFNGYHFWLMIAPMIIIWGIFILLSDEKIKSDYGNAKWAKTRDIKKMNLNMFADEGMILGVWKNKFIRTDQTLSVLLAAPPGTGKTVAVAIPNLLSCNYSMIVNDVKNELWEKTSLHRKKFQKVIRFAPAEEISSKWNPFSELPDNFKDQRIFLNRISTIIYPTTGDADKDHWPLSAQTLFKFFAFVSILDDSTDELTFFSIRKAILSTENIQEFAADYIDDFEETDDSYLNEFIQENVNSILQFEDKEFGSVVSTTKKALEIFNDPYIRKNMATSDFKIKELRQSKLTIYLCSNMKDAERIQPITRLFIELATVELLSDNPRDDQKVLILADEFVKMGKMQQLIKAPDLSRGQKLCVIFIVQSLSQPREVYGKDITDTLISTTAFKLILTQLSQTTMKEVSDLIGKKTVKKQSLSKNQSWKNVGGNKSISDEGQPLLLPQDVGSLKDSEIVIIAQGYNTRPIMAETCRWFKIPTMKNLVVENTENM